MITSLVAIGTIYASNGLPAFMADLGLAYDQGSFGGTDEFVYTIDAPYYVKEFGNKEVEKVYEFTNISEDISGIKVKASYVKLHIKTELLQSGTKIVFDALAENFEVNGLGYNAERDSADISGYGILNEETTKLTVHIPWAEIMKNL